MIEYTIEVTVRLDGKVVGKIKQMLSGGFAYFPKGNRGTKSLQGDTFDTLEECKRSLEN